MPLAFVAGLLSVFSPCVMPLMPAYLSLISGVSVEEMSSGALDDARRRQVIRASLGFILGFSTVFVVMGIGAFAIGHAIRSWHVVVFGLDAGIAQLAGVLIILLGVHMTGLVPIKALYRDTRFHFQISQRSFLATCLVGAGFAAGWTPCIGPILTGVLTLAGSRETALQGTVLLVVYSAGLAIPFLAASYSIELFFKAFAQVRQHFRKLEIASGAVLVAVGLLLMTGQLTRLNARFASMTEWVTGIEKVLQ